MSVTENILESQIEALRLQVIALQQLAYGDPQRTGSVLPHALTALQHSLDDLHLCVKTDSNGRHTEPSDSARGNGSFAKPTPPDRGTEVGKGTEQEVVRYRARVRSLMAELTLAEEHERRRLAIDLHDGLSQTIALAQMKLSALRLALDETMSEPVREIEALVEQANRSARSISFELSPLILHDLGLAPALQWLVENIQVRYGIEIALEDDGRPKLASERTRVLLFRAIRELLINAAKHSGATRVLVRLECDGARISVDVEDDGVGMDTDLERVGGFGLFSIHERVSHVGGVMHIDSAPGRGTKIHLCAPLNDAAHTETCTQP